MPFLDAIHLLLEPCATIEDEASVFGKEWRMTLEYVLHQYGLKMAYTSRLNDQHDVWVFLAWATEDDRSHFYHQTTGFGFLSDHMRKAPSVFFFGDGLYDAFEQIKEWTIDVFGVEGRDTENSKHTQGSKQVSDLQKTQYLGSLGSRDFMARQERAVFETLYQGNDFDNAFIGITATEARVEPNLACGLDGERYEVKLQRCEHTQYPSQPHTELPADIADLMSKHPWEYGVLSCDDSEYSDTATPMSLTFLSMSTLHMANKFLPERSHRQSLEMEATEQYFICIVSVSSRLPSRSRRDENSIRNLRGMIGLLDGLEGLRELRVLQTIAHNEEPEIVRFVCAWTTLADQIKWWHDYTINKQIGAGIRANIEFTWSSERIGWKNLEWDNMPLTSDKQHWQKVNKTLEIVQFAFTQNLTAGEKTTFEGRLYDLTNTMSSCWSGDIDERPVVYAETPVWTTAERVPPSCLLFLAWDGIDQRRAWLRNFLANSFTWTGHIAHTLGRICSRVESGTYEMETLFVWKSTYDGFARGVFDDDESDRDMGF